MPNWCSTEYAIHGSKIGVEKFKEALDEIEKNPPKLKNGAVADNDNHWLGSIVEYCGKDSKKVECRGWINYVYDVQKSDVEEDEYLLRFNVEDAWGPHPVPIKMLIEKIRYDHGVLLDYDILAEEPGCEVYIKSDDRYFPEKYSIQFDLDNKNGWETFESDKELVRFLNEVFELEYSTEDIDQLIDCVREKEADDPNGYFSLYEYEIVDKEA